MAPAATPQNAWAALKPVNICLRSSQVRCKRRARVDSPAWRGLRRRARPSACVLWGVAPARDAQANGCANQRARQRADVRRASRIDVGSSSSVRRRALDGHWAAGGAECAPLSHQRESSARGPRHNTPAACAHNQPPLAAARTSGH